MSDGDKMCGGPGAVTGIHAIVYYHQKVRKVKLRVPDDLGETKLFGVIKSLLSLPQEHQISISRYSKSKQRYVYLSSQAEFSALLRCATVKKRFSFIVTDKEVPASASAFTGDAVDTTSSSAAAKPGSELSEELVGRIVQTLQSNDGFRQMLDDLVQERSASAGASDVATTGTATTQGGGPESRGGAICGWPVDEKNVACNECGEHISEVRHKCVECSDYDLCSLCFEQMGHTHDPDHVFYCLTGTTKKAENNVTEKPVHHASCDKCGDGRRIEGSRYKCLDCDDFDMCETCFKTPESHNPAHSFVRLHEKDDFVAAKSGSGVSRNHHRCMCDGCLKPIVGSRFVCYDCVDFDYCATCMETKRPTSHPESHMFVRARMVDDVVYGKQTRDNHGEVYCDNCQEHIYRRRYKCLDCPNYDLCSNCIDTRSQVHKSEHSFIRIRSTAADVLRGSGNLRDSEKSRRSHPAFCDKCDKRITGVRYRCDECVDFDLCSECFPHRQVTHPEHTFIAVRDASDYLKSSSGPRIPPVHEHIYCDGPLCKDRVVMIKGVRYKCAICHDTDFCATCEASPLLDHDPSHPLIKLKVANPRLHLSTEYFLQEPLSDSNKNNGNQSNQPPQQQCPANKMFGGTPPQQEERPSFSDASQEQNIAPLCGSDSPLAQSPQQGDHMFGLLDPSTLSDTEQEQYRPAVDSPPPQQNRELSHGAGPQKDHSEPSQEVPVFGESMQAAQAGEVVRNFAKSVEEPATSNAVPDFDATLIDFSCHANGCLTWVYKNTGSMTWPRYTSVSPSSDEDHRTETIRWTYTPFATHPGGTVTFTAFTNPSKVDKIPREWMLKTPGGKEFGHRDFSNELSKSSSSEDSQVVLPTLPKESPSSSVFKTANSEATESVDDDFVDFSEADEESLSTDDGNFEVVELSELSD